MSTTTPTIAQPSGLRTRISAFLYRRRLVKLLLLLAPPLTWIVVGDRSKIEDGVRKLGLGDVTVIDADGKVVK